MKFFYDDSNAERLYLKRRNRILLLIVLGLVLIALSLPLCLLAKRGNAVAIEISLSILSSLYCCFLVYSVTFCLLPWKRELVKLQLLFSQENPVHEGEVISIGEEFTLQSDLRVRSVEIQLPEGKRRFYYETALGEPPFHEKERIAFAEGGGFLVGVEEKKG